jgi:hypothetical protein
VSPSLAKKHRIEFTHYTILRCLQQLEHRICPLCRKPFTLERVKKLHVDLPDPGAFSPDPALQLLQRLALVSAQDSSSEEFVEVVEHAKVFIDSHEQDPSVRARHLSDFWQADVCQ